MTMRSAKPPGANPAAVSGDRDNVLARCLSLDLEVGRADERIHALAGVRPDTGQSVVIPRVGNNLAPALARLDELADGADFVLGHNVIAFDLPYLRSADPRLRLLGLPAVDTLRLNPLAFPRNPYHHLVKHYQDGSLIRGRLSDPELDARLTLEVFDNQQKAFRDARPELLAAWHWLTTAQDGAGFDRFFSALRGAHRPSAAEAQDAIHRCLADNSCLTQARAAVTDAAQQGWELAYTLAWLSVAGGSSVMPPWVRHQSPGAGRLVRRLRDNACNDPDCDWCRERHDVRRELSRWFGFDDFRRSPRTSMAGRCSSRWWRRPWPASMCWPSCPPALSRYDKTGALTVVISPLVALMADQVAGLESRGIGSCVTVNGLLSMPERANALERVRLGDAGILIILPEQLRSVCPCGGSWTSGRSDPGCWTRPTASPGGATTSGPITVTWDASSARRRETSGGHEDASRRLRRWRRA